MIPRAVIRICQFHTPGISVAWLSTRVFGRDEDLRTLRRWLRHLGVSVSEDGKCGELKPCYPYRHGHWRVEYPRWVWEVAMKKHGWKCAEYQGRWRRPRKDDRPDERYDHDAAYPYYPKTQRRIWKEHLETVKEGA